MLVRDLREQLLWFRAQATQEHPVVFDKRLLFCWVFVVSALVKSYAMSLVDSS